MVQKQPEVTSHLVAEHGLKPDEYDRILKLIGRPPSFTELGIFSAMWNERGVDRSSLGELEFWTVGDIKSESRGDIGRCPAGV